MPTFRWKTTERRGIFSTKSHTPIFPLAFSKILFSFLILVDPAQALLSEIHLAEGCWGRGIFDFILNWTFDIL